MGGGFPLSFVTTRGSCITDVDNITYIDFAPKNISLFLLPWK